MLNFKVILALVAIIAPLFISHFTGGWVAVYTSHGFSVEKIPDLHGKVSTHPRHTHSGCAYIVLC